MEDSHIPLHKWLIAFHLLCASKKGMSAHQLHRMLGLGYRATWFMAHRIRYAMTQQPMLTKLFGIIEVDETYIGGKTKTGSQAVKRDAEKEGLHRVFAEAGFEWREPGCSMCLGMNPDILLPGERCASTSNRNFEGRQGRGGRTHLVSPVMAAAAAITGHFTDIRNWSYR